MAKIIKFVYSMIIYLSLFLVTMKVGSGEPFFLFRIHSLFRSLHTVFYHLIITSYYSFFCFIIEDICEADEDCPQSDNVFYVIKCIGNKCEESTKHF